MLKLPVRTLAEFVHRRGDLHARLDGRTRAEEGIAAQRQLQCDRGEDYQRERAVSLVRVLAGVEVTVAGRIDGCVIPPCGSGLQTANPTPPVGAVSRPRMESEQMHSRSGERSYGGEIEPLLIEEYKTTRADPEAAHAHHATVHWAQARLYGALLLNELGVERPVRLRLIYCHPDTLDCREHERVEDAAKVRAFLDRTLAEYEVWLKRQHAHEQHRNGHIAELPFPFPVYRPFQRAMARRTYKALRDREHLLLEAPTGSGKTAATLYPAVRALESAGYRRVLFLTSRNTGALAVRDAARRLDPEQRFLRHVSLTAKEKACFVPGTPCEPEACPYARGYFDRSRDAVVDVLAQRAAGPDEIARVAERHQVCPFELSLDAAVWADVVVGDYNYVFDPVVRLQRLAGDSDAAVLVDESHQLAPRVREMLSLCLTRREVKDALEEAVPDAVARRLRALDRALMKLKREHELKDERRIERPEPLMRALKRFTETLATVDEPLEPYPATREVLFTASRWLRAEAWYDPQRFLFLARAEGRSVTVRLVCIDPGPYIRERLAEFGGHVRFSGTVSPLELYAHAHGEPDAPQERAGNPFSAEQLGVLVVHDVPTYLRSRQGTIARLAQLVADITAARRGHYLVAFPSFEYLNLAAGALTEAHPGLHVVSQCPGMDDTARAEFIAGFRDDSAPRVGLVVLGGVFGESVDFSEASLAGVICVGVGLPPPSLERQALERHFESQGVDGRALAFHQPAMVKVLQMAGRLLRSPDDRGVLCLVDPRFREPAYQQFFPDHWQPVAVRAAEAGAAAGNFWNGDATFPRLRGLEKEHPS